MQIKLSGTSQIVLAMSIVGTLGVFVKESGQTPFNVVFFRCLFGSVCLGGYCFFTNQIKKEYFKPLVLLPICIAGAAIVFNWFFLFTAFKQSSITLSIIFYYTQPFFLMFLSVLFFKEKLTLNNCILALTAFIGLVLSINIVTISNNNFSQIIGACPALIAAFLYAVAIIVVKRLENTPAPFIAFIQTSLGIVLLYPFTTLHQVPWVGGHWVYLVSLGVFHTAIVYVLFYSGVKKSSTPVIAVLGFTEAIVAIFSGLIIYGETINFLQTIGILIMFFSGFAATVNMNLSINKFMQLFSNLKNLR